MEEQGLEEKLDGTRTEVKVPEKKYTNTETDHYVINKEIKFDDKTIMDIIKENSNVMKEIILDIDEKIKKNKVHNNASPLFIVTYIKNNEINVHFDFGLKEISDYCCKEEIQYSPNKVFITTIDAYKIILGIEEQKN